MSLFKVLINLSTTTDFPSSALKTFLYNYSAKVISLIYCKIPCLYLLLFFCFAIRFFLFFLRSTSNFNNYLSIRRITYACSLKISIAYHKRRIPLLNLLINYISVRSAHKISSVKNECTFLLLNFIINGLCNS